jgi:hypothetical protein
MFKNLNQFRLTHANDFGVRSILSNCASAIDPKGAISAMPAFAKRISI